ncbi:MAG: DNA polymerase III subunit beta [Pseudomonadales bacterium]|jgi:DNA polymerase III subunit beta|nr:DNA polymerase III subunit beta [Pseudomonadales bacterium]MDP4639726.1 DNA polymerase III subunit beta [Pseudomonadales bacterium]MDP4874639.1 DNA polymerase III subunit beta [Pseudomonadales bacterium]MDP5059361.1 DNA polymerase III subunit beta [Pseudomonadales bacterium]
MTMKFEIDRDALVQPLQFVSGVVERRQTVPVLANLLMQVKAGELSLIATDQEVELRASTNNLLALEEGSATIPARKLVDICRSLPSNTVVTCELEGARLSIASGQFRSHLATLPVTDFPHTEMDEVKVEQILQPADLQALLDKTMFAMAQQDVRYFFNGMLIEIDAESVSMVATNGQRLAINQLSGRFAVAAKQQFIVPRKGVVELMRMVKDEPLKLEFAANHLRVTAGHLSLITKLIDATYPDYQRAIPVGGDKVVNGARSEIRDALTRTGIFANEMYRNVSLNLSPGNLKIKANNPQQEEAEENVAVDYDGSSLEIGFNVGYLIDALSVIAGDRVQMTFTDGNSAVLLRSPDDSQSRFVISPMML